MRSIGGVITSAPGAYLSGIGARAIGYAILGVLWMRPFWTHSFSCPMGLHDWAYPCLDAQRTAYLPSLVAPWWDTDLGIAHSLPQITLPWIVLGALVSLSPAIGVRIFLLAAFVAAALAADVAAARLFGVRQDWARGIAGALYVASPFLATKLASGQLGFIACAALVPATLIALDAVARGAGFRAWAACALCAASAFAQLQVGIVLLALLPVVGWGRVRARVWLGVWAVAALTWAPAAYSTIAAYRSGALAPEAQLSVWLADKSVPWMHALDGTAYFAQYFTSTAPAWSSVAWTFAALAGLVAALVRRGAPRRVAIFALVLGVLSTGTTGPIAPVVSRLFDDLPAAQVFREFYDLLFLAPLVIACGNAASAERLASSHVSHAADRVLGLAEAAVLAALLLPAVAGGAASLVPFVGGLPQAPTIAGDDRILWLPATPPIGPPDSIGGADPYQLAVDGHPDASAFHPTGVAAYVAALADRGDAVSADLLTRLDIVDVIVRPGLESRRIATSASVHEGGVASTAAPATTRTASILAIADGAPLCEPDLRGALGVDDDAYVRWAPAWSVVPHEDPAASTDDPGRSWIDGERWALIDPKLAEPRWPVLFTRSASPYRWMSPSDGFTWIYAPGGARFDDSDLPRSSRWRRVKTTAGRHLFHGDGRSIVAISATLPATPSTRRDTDAPHERPLNATRSDRLLGRFEATLPPHDKAFVVLRAGWSANWRASVDGRDIGAPAIADGYAAGWALRADPMPSTLTISYAPARAYLALLSIAWLALLLLVVFIARPFTSS